MEDLKQRAAPPPLPAGERPGVWHDGRFNLARLTGGETSLHVTAMPHLMVALRGNVTLRSARQTVTGQAVLALPGEPHTVDGGGGLFYVLSLNGFLAAPAAHGAPLRRVDGAALNAFVDYLGRLDSDEGGALAERLRLPAMRLSPPLALLVTRLQANPMHRLSQFEAAALTGLERTALLKRFRHETGLTFRAYKNWVGVSTAIDRLRRGATAAQAAMDAGFADLAHLSRQFRATTGYSPRQAAAYVEQAAAQARDAAATAARSPPPAPG